MWLPPEIRDTGVAKRAAALGLGLRALGSYTRAPMRCNGLVLGYGNLEEGMLAESVRRLVVAVQSQDTDRREA
jgi:GntR family transcriptional regulator/MocR family aminotransferase